MEYKSYFSKASKNIISGHKTNLSMFTGNLPSKHDLHPRGS